MHSSRKILLALIATCLSTGCAALHQHLLGTRVHSWDVKGVNYVHCSILMDRAKAQEAQDAIKVCQDEMQAPQVQTHRR